MNLKEARKARDEAFAAYTKAQDTFNQLENSLLKQILAHNEQHQDSF